MSDSDFLAASSEFRTALETLEALHVPFRGPFVTPKQNRIYLVDGCVLTEAEIASFHEGGNFAPERIRSFLRNLRSTQSPRPYYLEPSAGPVFQDRRRGERTMLRLNLVVRLETSKGRPRQTHAFTVVVNANGGQLRSPFRMAVDQEITLVNPQTAKEVRCRVVEAKRTAEGNYLVSFGFEQPDPSFWPMSCPGSIEAKN
jgi:hypothetical protein